MTLTCQLQETTHTVSATIDQKDLPILTAKPAEPDEQSSGIIDQIGSSDSTYQRPDESVTIVAILKLFSFDGTVFDFKQGILCSAANSLIPRDDLTSAAKAFMSRPIHL